MDFSAHHQSDHTATDLRAPLHVQTASARPTLQVLTGVDAGRILALTKGTTVVGRSLDSEMVLNDESISRQHAEIYTSSAAAPIIYDLESKNGTKVNGEPISPTGQVLIEGDQVRLSANMILKFSWQKPEEEALQGSLYHCAVRDWLTQTYNKRYFIERLAQEFSYAERHHRPLSLLLVDIDHFKGVNDQFGHDAGDHVLREISKFMKTQLREEDVLARYGGEEFAILLRQIDLAEAVLVAERLRVGLKNTSVHYLEQSVQCTTSIGVACTSKNKFKDPNQLFVLADQRLYEAKASGRNKTVFGNPDDLDAPDEDFFRRPTSPPKET